METREQELRRGIDSRRQAIADGVSVENRDRMEREIVELEGELNNELKEPESTEPILAEIGGIPLESYTETIDGAVLIRGAVQVIVDRYEIIIKAGKVENETQIRENGNLRDYITKLNEQITDLTATDREQLATINQLTLERDDAYKVRDNAARQIEELTNELEQIRVELNKSKEFTAQTEAERTAEQEEARKRFLDSRIKIANVRWEDENNRKIKVAELADTGEELKFHYLEHGKFTEVSQEEADAIRLMNQPIEMPEVATVEPFLPVQNIPFREEKVYDRLESSTGGPDQGVQASETVTLESLNERVKALEDRFKPTVAVAKNVA